MLTSGLPAPVQSRSINMNLHDFLIIHSFAFKTQNQAVRRTPGHVSKLLARLLTAPQRVIHFLCRLRTFQNFYFTSKQTLMKVKTLQHNIFPTTCDDMFSVSCSERLASSCYFLHRSSGSFRIFFQISKLFQYLLSCQNPSQSSCVPGFADNNISSILFQLLSDILRRGPSEIHLAFLQTSCRGQQ